MGFLARGMASPSLSSMAGSDASRHAVAGADVVCFGTLAQRGEIARTTIRTLLKLAPADALCIFDVNLRQHYYSRDLIEECLRLANVLKVNDAELPVLTEMFGLHGHERQQVAQLAQRFHLRMVAYTRGNRGSLLHGDGQWSDYPGLPTQVADTVGAGDSFTAALALGWRAGWPLDEVNRRANEVAAFVCSQSGGAPRLPSQLRQPFLAILHVGQVRKVSL
jgi:fructokinase